MTDIGEPDCSCGAERYRLAGLDVWPNTLNRSAQQRRCARCWVPAPLRVAAPG